MKWNSPTLRWRSVPGGQNSIARSLRQERTSLAYLRSWKASVAGTQLMKESGTRWVLMGLNHRGHYKELGLYSQWDGQPLEQSRGTIWLKLSFLLWRDSVYMFISTGKNGLNCTRRNLVRQKKFRNIIAKKDWRVLFSVSTRFVLFCFVSCSQVRMAKCCWNIPYNCRCTPLHSYGSWSQVGLQNCTVITDFFHFFKDFFNPPLRICLLIWEREAERERQRERDRETERNIDVREKHQSVVSHTCPYRG